MTTRIYVDKGCIENNERFVRRDPPIVIRRGDNSIEHALQVEILGPSRIVYTPHHDIEETGAQLVIETESEVVAG